MSFSMKPRRSYGDDGAANEEPLYQRLETYQSTPLTPPRQYYGHQQDRVMQHSFSGAFRFGLGLEIGLILSIPIGILITLLTLFLFGNLLIRMIQQLG